MWQSVVGTNCAPLLADIFLYSYEADFIQSLLSTGKKHLASRFNLTYRYIDDVLSINNPEFEHYLNLRSRTPQRAPLLLLTYIYYCRLGGMVNFTLRSTTNGMISISTSQTFRSWVVIFHLSQPMAFLSLNSYDTPGLTPRMNVLFWGPGDFPVSYSNRDISRNAWNRHSGSFMVDTGILFINMKYPSHEC